MSKTYPQSVRDWCSEQTRCAVCWCDIRHCWPPGSVHHILGRRRKRCDELWALIALCGSCHNDIHGPVRPGFPGLKLGHILGVKFELSQQHEREYGHWDQDKLEELYGKRLPNFEPLPQEYLDERKLHRRYGG